MDLLTDFGHNGVTNTNNFAVCDVYLILSIVSVSPQTRTTSHLCIWTWILLPISATCQGLCDWFWNLSVLLSLSEILISGHVSPAGALPSCHLGCQLLWHSITLSVAAIAKVPHLGLRRSLHPSSDWLIWPGQESRYLQPEMRLSASDRITSATGLVLFDIFQSVCACVQTSAYVSLYLWMCISLSTDWNPQMVVIVEINKLAYSKIYVTASEKKKL